MDRKPGELTWRSDARSAPANEYERQFAKSRHNGRGLGVIDRSPKLTSGDAARTANCGYVALSASVSFVGLDHLRMFLPARLRAHAMR